MVFSPSPGCDSLNCPRQMCLLTSTDKYMYAMYPLLYSSDFGAHEAQGSSCNAWHAGRQADILPHAQGRGKRRPGCASWQCRRCGLDDDISTLVKRWLVEPADTHFFPPQQSVARRRPYVPGKMVMKSRECFFFHIASMCPPVRKWVLSETYLHRFGIFQFIFYFFKYKFDLCWKMLSSCAT